MNGAAAVELAKPSFEVKLFLDPAKVLDVEFKPTRDADREFGLKNSNRKIAMQFLDARPRLLDGAGWNVRLRRREDDRDVELSFKRRYRVDPGPLENALAKAAVDGFTAAEDDYEAQVEWGMPRQTLSFTRKKEFDVKGPGGVELPARIEAIAMALRDLPGKLDRQQEPGLARGVLADAHVYGPVLGKRWAGEWSGPPLAFEVWMIRAEQGPGYEPVVELSFKAERRADADRDRERLIQRVREREWLITHDVLKTKMILDRY